MKFDNLKQNIIISYNLTLNYNTSVILSIYRNNTTIISSLITSSVDGISIIAMRSFKMPHFIRSSQFESKNAVEIKSI